MDQAVARSDRLIGSDKEREMVFVCGHSLDAPTPCPLDMVLHGRRVFGWAEVRTWWSPAFLRWTPLDPSPRHSPARFRPYGLDWGDAGGESAQLALAACALVAGDERARAVYRRVKDILFAPLDCEEWLLHLADLETVMLAVADDLDTRGLDELVKRVPHAP